MSYPPCEHAAAHFSLRLLQADASLHWQSRCAWTGDAVHASIAQALQTPTMPTRLLRSRVLLFPKCCCFPSLGGGAVCRPAGEREAADGAGPTRRAAQHVSMLCVTEQLHERDSDSDHIATWPPVALACVRWQRIMPPDMRLTSATSQHAPISWREGHMRAVAAVIVSRCTTDANCACGSGWYCHNSAVASGLRLRLLLTAGARWTPGQTTSCGNCGRRTSMRPSAVRGTPCSSASHSLHD